MESFAKRFSPPDEDVILYETEFNDDILGRIKVSKRLSAIVERIEDPLVIALDGRWGTGKSYFLKRWVGAHRRQNEGTAQTLYFDAFAHDYQSDPLIALVGALANHPTIADHSKLQRIKAAAFKFVKPIARIGLAVGTAGASEAVNAIGDAAISALQNEANAALSSFWAQEQGRQSAMEEFRAALASLTNTGDGENPNTLVIVIDELDRCRPDYALELLEVIKHFFSVPHVHFVLGVNLTSLENSVKARYGAAMEARDYLQKFLSFTISLPDHVDDHEQTPASVVYVEQLGAVMGTPPHLLEKLTQQLNYIGKQNHVSIRDAGKILSTISLLPEEVLDRNAHFWGWHFTLITMIIAKVVRPDLLPKLINLTISKEELVAYFGAYDHFVLEHTDSGELNQTFDRGLARLYEIWRALGGNADGKTGDDLNRLCGQFMQFPDPSELRRIPRKISKKWLDGISN